MTFALPVKLQMTETFIPSLVTRIPTEADFIQFLPSTFTQGVSARSLHTHPLTKAKAVFVMLLWDAAITLTLFIER